MVFKLFGVKEVRKMARLGRAQVAQKTLENFDEFWLCGGCGKVYWEGKMFVKALDHFRSFMPEGERQKEPFGGSKWAEKLQKQSKTSKNAVKTAGFP